MRYVIPTVVIACPLWIHVVSAADLAPTQRGTARAMVGRPERFPHRIWAACDFESPLPDYAWFGKATTEDVPTYPGNVTALASTPYKDAAVMAGINPVPGPKMGKVNYLYCRYRLSGADEATFQHFSLTREDNNHIRVSGLTKDKWSEVTLNFTRDAARNDGSAEAFAEGERMDDLKVMVGRPGQTPAPQILLDDVIFFANDPALPPEPEPFPKRVIYLAAFDTGIDPVKATEPAAKRGKYKYWPGDLDIVTKDAPAGAYWGVARAAPKKDGKGCFISLMIEPPKPVGERTKLRFRYHLTGASDMTVQVFDATDQDNRHVRLKDLKQGQWATVYVDFTKDGRRNDGGTTPFAAGHKVDDIFFFVDGADAKLHVDEVVLFDAGK